MSDKLTDILWAILISACVILLCVAMYEDAKAHPDRWDRDGYRNTQKSGDDYWNPANPISPISPMNPGNPASPFRSR
jgi:hypothetical protein